MHSIREFGLMQPIVVRAVPGSTPVRYQIIMGSGGGGPHRRSGCRRCRRSSGRPLTRISRDALPRTFTAQLNPLEAAAYQQLLDEFGVTHDELASRIGRSRPLISNMIRLLRLPIAVQRRVAAGSRPGTRALLSLDGGAEAQEELAARDRCRRAVGAAAEVPSLANRSDDPSRGPAAQADPHARAPGCGGTAVECL